ncbi:MAG: hypothetical protein ABEK50_09060 [bacterium]
MDNGNEIESSWPESVQQTSDLLKHLEEGFMPVRFVSDVDRDLNQFMEEEGEGHEFVQPVLLFERGEQDPELMLWSLSKN